MSEDTTIGVLRYSIAWLVFSFGTSVLLLSLRFVGLI